MRERGERRATQSAVSLDSVSSTTTTTTTEYKLSQFYTPLSACLESSRLTDSTLTSRFRASCRPQCPVRRRFQHREDFCRFVAQSSKQRCERGSLCVRRNSIRTFRQRSERRNHLLSLSHSRYRKREGGVHKGNQGLSRRGRIENRKKLPLTEEGMHCEILA